MSRSQRKVTFRGTDDPRWPWEASVDGERWTVRVDELPEAASAYSLFVDGRLVEELMTWPVAWIRPKAPVPSREPPAALQGRADDDPHERAELEREEAHLERTRQIRPSKRVR